MITGAQRHERATLDTLLTRIEDALERGERRVGEPLFQYAAAVLPECSAGMALSKAMELVFARQASLVKGGHATLSVERTHPSQRVARAVGQPMTTSDARRLTDKIRTQLSDGCCLLLEAHDRQAWKALGYRSWSAYIAKELGVSRSRSYELLDQARVQRALTEATGSVVPITLSAFAAAEIKPLLPQVVAEVKMKCEAITPSHVHAVVAAVVQDARLAGRRSEPLGAHASRLLAAINYLACQPQPRVVAAGLPTSVLAQLNRLSDAAEWLEDFAVAVRQLGPQHGQTQSGVPGSPWEPVRDSGQTAPPAFVSARAG